MHKKNLKRLKTDLNFCCKSTAKRKFRSRFGETDLVEEAKKKNEKDKEEREKKAKEDAEKKAIQQKKEKNKKRLKLLGKIAIGTALAGGTYLAATRTQTGRNITSDINNTVVKPIAQIGSNAGHSALTMVGLNAEQRKASQQRREQYEQQNKSMNESVLATAKANNITEREARILVNNHIAQQSQQAQQQSEQQHIENEARRISREAFIAKTRVKPARTGANVTEKKIVARAMELERANDTLAYNKKQIEDQAEFEKKQQQENAKSAREFQEKNAKLAREFQEKKAK